MQFACLKRRNRLFQKRTKHCLHSISKALNAATQVLVLARRVGNKLGSYVPCFNPFNLLFLCWESIVFCVVLAMLFYLPYQLVFVNETSGQLDEQSSPQY